MPCGHTMRFVDRSMYEVIAEANKHTEAHNAKIQAERESEEKAEAKETESKQE